VTSEESTHGTTVPGRNVPAKQEVFVYDCALAPEEVSPKGVSKTNLWNQSLKTAGQRS